MYHLAIYTSFVRENEMKRIPVVKLRIYCLYLCVLSILELEAMRHTVQIMLIDKYYSN